MKDKKTVTFPSFAALLASCCPLGTEVVVRELRTAEKEEVYHQNGSNLCSIAISGLGLDAVWEKIHSGQPVQNNLALYPIVRKKIYAAIRTIQGGKVKEVRFFTSFEKDDEKSKGGKDEEDNFGKC